MALLAKVRRDLLPSRWRVSWECCWVVVRAVLPVESGWDDRRVENIRIYANDEPWRLFICELLSIYRLRYLGVDHKLLCRLQWSELWTYEDLKYSCSRSILAYEITLQNYTLKIQFFLTSAVVCTYLEMRNTWFLRIFFQSSLTITIAGSSYLS